MDNNQLYEKIIYNVAKYVKRVLNEETYKFDVTEYQDESDSIINRQVINDIIDNSFLPILLKEYNVYDWSLGFSDPPAIFYLRKKDKNARSQMIVAESIKVYIESISHELENGVSVKEIRRLHREGNIIASVYKNGREFVIKIAQLSKINQDRYISKEINFDFTGNLTIYIGRHQTYGEKLQWDWNNALQGGFYIVSINDLNVLIDKLMDALNNAYYADMKKILTLKK